MIQIFILKKMAVNMMIGGFKPNLNKNVKWLSVCITANSCEAHNQYLQNIGNFGKTFIS